MIDEKTMRAAMQAYIDLFNAGNVAAVVDLYSDDANVEDPVGTPPKKGREEITAFYETGIKTGAQLALAAPIRASHGSSAAMAFDVELDMPEGRSIIRVIDVMTFNEAGKFTSMKAYWGPGDMQPLAS